MATKRLGIALLLAFACSSSAYGQGTEMAGGFVGVSLGQNTLKDWDTSLIDDGSFTSASSEDSDVGFRIFGGYDFSEHFGIEAGFSDFGEVTIDAQSNGCCFWSPGPVSAKASADGFDFSLVGKLPVSDVAAITGRFGFLFWDSESSIADSSGSAAGSDDGNDVLFGIGGEYSGFRPLRIRGEFARYKFDDDDVDTLSVSLVYLLNR